MVAGQPEPVAVVLVGGQDRLEVPVGVDLEFVDEAVGGRGDSVHRLQADVSGSAPAAEDPIRLARAQARIQIHTVRAFQAPGDDVVHARRG